MATKEECDKFAAELLQRFDAMTAWAITHWPRPDLPLMASDFEESRKELSVILGPKLEADGKTARAGAPQDSGSADSGQYIDMNPMPWP